MSSETFQNTLLKILKKHRQDPTALISILTDVQSQFRHISDEAIHFISEQMNLTPLHIEGVATFYHFFSKTHRGNITIYLNTSATAEMAGVSEVATSLESELGITFGETTSDMMFGLYKTSCIGMSDQEPAALINDLVFTRLTPLKVKILIAALKQNESLKKIHSKMKDSQVTHTVQQKGPFFFTDSIPGTALKKTFEKSSLEIIEIIKKSKLRGRGGAGFPTGQKWAYCRATEADARYVVCNIDEGEPGTFKDRVLLTEKAELILEGMVIAGYAIEAHQGIVYLRGEYTYLKKHLEKTLKKFRSQNFLGTRILGTRYNFDIEIKMGAGAYICGEESALIESAEGRRGVPRNRPPFPVVSGYLHKPTIVNNPETFGCVTQILNHDAEFFLKMGTSESSGVKLLSVAGDCERPGIYEIEWGKSIRDILKLCGAKDTLAVQLGGPSGQCLSEKQWDRKICYSDLGTGGAFTIFNTQRDLLSIVHNHMEFFTKESCGFCVPCRAGNVILLNHLEKIMIGNGTATDLKKIKELSQLVRTTSRCGLGQTSPNPLTSTLENFSEYYSQKVRHDTDYISQFDMNFAIAESCAVAQRQPHLEKEE